jgi:hypothetical protein
MVLDELQQTDERYRAEHEDYQRRMAERQREQLQRHQANPHRVPLYLHVDDDEFGTEAYTAGWRQESGA